MTQMASIKALSEKISRQVDHFVPFHRDFQQLEVDLEELCKEVIKLEDLCGSTIVQLQELVVLLQEQE